MLSLTPPSLCRNVLHLCSPWSTLHGRTRFISLSPWACHSLLRGQKPQQLPAICRRTHPHYASTLLGRLRPDLGGPPQVLFPFLFHQVAATVESDPILNPCWTFPVVPFPSEREYSRAVRRVDPGARLPALRLHRLSAPPLSHLSNGLPHKAVVRAKGGGHVCQGSKFCVAL